jgi:hypothetical protein
MRRSSAFLTLTAGLTALSVIACAQAAHRRRSSEQEIGAKQALVRSLGLTDICLFTEASYTRHPSQADTFTPFQDHPMSFEHFPSGSFVPPHRPGKRAHGRLD